MTRVLRLVVAAAAVAVECVLAQGGADDQVWRRVKSAMSEVRSHDAVVAHASLLIAVDTSGRSEVVYFPAAIGTPREAPREHELGFAAALMLADSMYRREQARRPVRVACEGEVTVRELLSPCRSVPSYYTPAGVEPVAVADVERCTEFLSTKEIGFVLSSALHGLHTIDRFVFDRSPAAWAEYLNESYVGEHVPGVTVRRVAGAALSRPRATPVARGLVIETQRLVRWWREAISDGCIDGVHWKWTWPRWDWSEGQGASSVAASVDCRHGVGLLAFGLGDAEIRRLRSSAFDGQTVLRSSFVPPHGSMRRMMGGAWSADPASSLEVTAEAVTLVLDGARWACRRSIVLEDAVLAGFDGEAGAYLDAFLVCEGPAVKGVLVCYGSDGSCKPMLREFRQ